MRQHLHMHVSLCMRIPDTYAPVFLADGSARVPGGIVLEGSCDEFGGRPQVTDSGVHVSAESESKPWSSVAQRIVSQLTHGGGRAPWFTRIVTNHHFDGFALPPMGLITEEAIGCAFGAIRPAGVALGRVRHRYCRPAWFDGLHVRFVMSVGARPPCSTCGKGLPRGTVMMLTCQPHQAVLCINTYVIE